jgi:hypothetical protein
MAATKRKRTPKHTTAKHKAAGPSLSKCIGRTPIRSAAKLIGSLFGSKKPAKRTRRRK